ncbi:MAG: calcium-binding protein [Rubrobacter sp.]
MALVVLLACGVALAATIDCLGGGALCFGTDEPDTLNGSPERDEMFGQRGDDTLKGAAGNDSLEGQGGVDNVRGGNGNDYLEGNERADRLHGGPGADGLVDNSYRVGPLAPPRPTTTHFSERPVTTS